MGFLKESLVMSTSHLVDCCRICLVNPAITNYHSCQQCINSITALKICSNCSKNRVIFGLNTCNECKNKFYSSIRTNNKIHVYVEKKERGIHHQDCDHSMDCLNFKIVPASRGREFSRCKKC